ncbi:hypothetical protein Tco_0059779 [Tanacetum coccineum]
MNKLSFEEDEEASGEDKDEEEEHLAPADSVALPAIDPIPLAEETEPFEKDKARKTVRLQPPMTASIEALIVEFASAPTTQSPPPSPLLPWSSPLPQIPSPPILVLSPPLPLPSPPTHTSPTFANAPLGYKATMIQSRATSPPPVPSPPLLLPYVSHPQTGPRRNTCPRAQDAHELHMRDEDAQDDRALLRAQISLLTRERQNFCSMASSYEREPQRVARCIGQNKKQTETVEIDDDTPRFRKAKRSALTWWNSHVKTVGHDAAYRMPWKTLKKMMTTNYTQRFQEFALMCGRMFLEESDEVEKYVGVLCDYDPKQCDVV